MTFIFIMPKPKTMELAPGGLELRKHWLFYFLSMMLFLIITGGCNRRPQYSGPQYGRAPVGNKIPIYSFAIHPLHNPKKLLASYQPLIDYLNLKLKDAHLTLEASRDYAAFEEKFKNRKLNFILPNPWQTLQAIKVGYHVIAMAGEAADFRGIFISRKDSAIKYPSDLKGKAISYPSPTALAACIMPQYFLYLRGVNITFDTDNRYVGSQESAIMNAYLGNTAVGATWPPPWRAFVREHPREAADLKVLWETEPLINNSVMARNDVPDKLRNRIQALLIHIHQSAAGKKILSGMETSRFIQSKDSDYKVVHFYVSRFEKHVRRVENK